MAVTYDASPAISGTGHDHVIWLPGLSFAENNFDFNGGVFTENYGTGTATLSGTAVKGGNGFIINALFSGYVPNSDPGSIADAPNTPKDEGFAADAGNWWYYTATSGTLGGIGGFNNRYFSFVRKGPAFQAGYGASGKNANFGSSGWLDVFETDSNGVRIDQTVYHGDFNLDLKRVPDSGTTSALLGLGLVGLFAIRRRMHK